MPKAFVGHPCPLNHGFPFKLCGNDNLVEWNIFRCRFKNQSITPSDPFQPEFDGQNGGSYDN